MYQRNEFVGIDVLFLPFRRWRACAFSYLDNRTSKVCHVCAPGAMCILQAYRLMYVPSTEYINDHSDDRRQISHDICNHCTQKSIFFERLLFHPIETSNAYKNEIEQIFNSCKREQGLEWFAGKYMRNGKWLQSVQTKICAKKQARTPKHREDIKKKTAWN